MARKYESFFREIWYEQVRDGNEYAPGVVLYVLTTWEKYGDVD